MIDAILLLGSYVMIIWAAFASVRIVYRAICKIFTV